jgi:hypothetical protein
VPGIPDHLAGAASASTYHKISGASTNADTVKASAGIVTGYYLVNTATEFRYVKLYNKASDPTVGTDTPRCVYGIPPESAANMNFQTPIAFGTGIAIAIVTGISDADATAVAADDVAVTLHYV